MPLKWIAAGLNAHHQISPSDGDVKQFIDIGNSVIGVLLSTWSTLVVRSTNAIVSYGHQQWSLQLDDSVMLRSLIGDHNGFQAGLDEHGRLYLLSPKADSSEKSLELMETETSPSLAFLAMAGNGRIACVFAQAPNGNLAHVGEFATFDAFKAWHSNPTAHENYPIAHHMIPGRPKQLVAGSASFAMLMNDNNLYTWGDPRHRSLARSTIEPGSTPADKPGLVDALAGLKLRKIALGGWMGAALSEDGAGYVWGSSMPGKQQPEIECLTSNDGEHVDLIELGGDEEPDVVDLAVGDGHAVVVTTGGEAFVIGENYHGQLGLDAGQTFVGSWTRVDIGHATHVICGPKSTFLLGET